MTMSSFQKLNVANILNNGAIKIAAGLAAGMVGCYVPFAGSFSLARLAHLNAGSVSGFEAVIAGAGLSACIMGVIAIYDSRGSLKAVSTIGVVLFALVGLLVSLTV
jgi:hypothetical protein